MAAGGAAAAAIIQAIKASGVLVRVTPEEFAKVLNLANDPLVVIAEGGFFDKGIKYMTAYKGLAFWTKSKDAISLPKGAEVIQAGSIWAPG